MTENEQKGGRRRKSTGKRILHGLFAGIAAVLVLALGYTCYVLMVPRTAQHTIDEYKELYPENTIAELSEDLICVSPDAESTAGIIFYPGAQVTPEAYIPLLEELAERNYTCYVFRMPYNFALLGKDKASALLESGLKDPAVTEWYIAGHSLGGSAASMYSSEHEGLLDGIILLASRANADLSETDLSMIALFGSNDTVLNRSMYEKSRKNNPKAFTEYVIEGGNHAQFGDYGEQLFDSQAEISAQEQRSITADQIDLWIKKQSE